MSSEPQEDQKAGAPTDGSATPVPTSKTRPTIPTSTVVVGGLLVFIVGLGLGFFLGHRAHRIDGLERFARDRRGSMWFEHGGNAPRIASGPGAMMGSAPFAGHVIAGTVTAVDGDTLTVRTLGGMTMEVTATAGTQVRVSAPGSLADLGTGSTVVVVGSPVGAGTFSASRIIQGVLPSGGMLPPPSSGAGSP